MDAATPPISPRSVLSDDGPVARALAARGIAFESREQQLRMTDAVAGALEDRARLLVEAGTGVGKSFAYLVPAILRCVLHGQRVVVSTNTIALQEQLIGKDIPLLQQTLSEWGIDGLDDRPALNPVLVKGRSNYLSIRRLELASQRQETLFTDRAQRSTLHEIEQWAYETRDGSLASLPVLRHPTTLSAVWDHARSDSDNCMGRKCPRFDQCFYQEARRQMERGNLLVTNHALLFADLALRARPRVSEDGGSIETSSSGAGGILPEYHHLIIDEAHGAEDVACDHFGLRLSESKVARLLRTLASPRRRKGYLYQRSLMLAESDSVQKALVLCEKAELASRAFFEDLLGLHESGKLPAGRIREPGIVDNHLSQTMRQLALRLRAIRGEVESEPDRFELQSYARRASEIADAAELLLDQRLPGQVYWVEAEQRRAAHLGPRVTIACSPVDVGPLLREHLFERPIGIVLTSATLATRAVSTDEPTERAETAFGHTISSLGVAPAIVEGQAETPVRTLQLGSPFEYARQVRLYVDTCVSDPRAPGSARTGVGNGRGVGSGRGGGVGGVYYDSLVDRMLPHLHATQGGAFVLFTSFAAMHAVADRIERELRLASMPLLVQGRDGSRTAVLERFIGEPNAVLFGAATFWQGVDVRGERLRNVVITKLPFDPPDRPITQARCELIEERGGNPFMEDSLPRAVIRFKQGFGRLVRSRDDTGRVVVLDPRVVTKRYGRLFLDALPEGVPVEVIAEDRAGRDDTPF